MMIPVLLAAFGVTALAQEAKTINPDVSVVGLKLGERAAAKTFLDGFQPRQTADGRPVYYFYNKNADQVLKLTAASFEDKYLLTEIEVYQVDATYRMPHFQAEKISFFKTEKDIFVGYKQSKASAITGIPNVDGKDMSGPKTIIRKIGEPTERVENGKQLTLVYKLPGLSLADEAGKTGRFVYTARYEFYDNRLQRFILKISDQ